MKPCLLIFLFLLLSFASQPSAAQEQYLWLKLSSNRVMINVLFQKVQGDSIGVVRDGRRVLIPIQSIEQIRVMEKGSILEGAAVGVSIGAGVGLVGGFLAHPEKDRGWRIGTSTMYIGIIGGIVGSVVGSMDHMRGVVDLTGKSNAEKKEIVLRFLGSGPN